MKVVAVCNQKGGVAKTTTANILSAALCGRGAHVLAVDLDPQSNLSFSSGVDLLSMPKKLYDVFKGMADVRDVVLETDLGYDLLPGGLELAGADMDFASFTGREYMLREALSQIEDRYEYAVIDTPPTLGLLTVNAMTAANYIIIPASADVYSLQGISQLNALVNSVRKYTNKDLKVSGILITKYNGRTNISKALMQQMDEAAKKIGTIVFHTKIRESVAVREAALMKEDLLKGAPKANAAQDYNNFVEEFLEGIE